MSKRKLNGLSPSGSSASSKRPSLPEATTVTAADIDISTRDVIKETNRLSNKDYADKHIPKDLLFYTPEQLQTPQPAVYEIIYKATTSSKASNGIAEIISPTELAECFDLIESTSAEAYRSSSRGWRPGAKRAEMKKRDMRYLLVRRKLSPEVQSGVLPIHGFLSYMHDYESGIPVVYIYEIHLAASHRGCGLGLRLIHLAETIAASSGVEKVMLTVFRCNDTAIRWYEKRGWEVDEDSPAPRKLRTGADKEADYLILSKRVKAAEALKANDAE